MRARHIGRIKGNPEAEAALVELRRRQKEVDERIAFLEKQIENLSKETEDAWYTFFSVVRKYGSLPESFDYKKSDDVALQIGINEEDLFYVQKEQQDHPLMKMLKL